MTWHHVRFSFLLFYIIPIGKLSPVRTSDVLAKEGHGFKRCNEEDRFQVQS
jgi:hypothetical protein